MSSVIVAGIRQGERGTAGATMIAISRGREVMLVSDGHEILRAGDVLALAGTRPAIEAARQVLAHGEDGSPAEPDGPMRPKST